MLRVLYYQIKEEDGDGIPEDIQKTKNELESHFFRDKAIKPQIN
jgi:hypothetical protein